MEEAVRRVTSECHRVGHRVIVADKMGHQYSVNLLPRSHFDGCETQAVSSCMLNYVLEAFPESLGLVVLDRTTISGFQWRAGRWDWLFAPCSPSLAWLLLLSNFLPFLLSVP